MIKRSKYAITGQDIKNVVLLAVGLMLVHILYMLMITIVCGLSIYFIVDSIVKMF